jgi:transcription antitermination factor NusG
MKTMPAVDLVWDAEAPDTANWYAIQVLANQENRAEAALDAKGYRVCLPTYTAGKSHRPLFPGYLFCALTPGSSGLILQTAGVVRVVSFGSKWAAIKPSEMRALLKISSSPVNREPWAHLPTGCLVRIDSGPLKGIQGTLIHEPTKNRVVVSVSLLQRSLAVVVDPAISLIPLSPQTDWRTAAEN